MIFEIHPLAYFLENAVNSEKHNPNYATSYFEKGPYSYKDGLDYIGGVLYPAKNCYWFMHKMSDILNAMVSNNIEITEFNEYNFEITDDPEKVKLAPEQKQFLEGEIDQTKFPLSYLLTGKKK